MTPKLAVKWYGTDFLTQPISCMERNETVATFANRDQPPRLRSTNLSYAATPRVHSTQKAPCETYLIHASPIVNVTVNDPRWA